MPFCVKFGRLDEDPTEHQRHREAQGQDGDDVADFAAGEADVGEDGVGDQDEKYATVAYPAAIWNMWWRFRRSTKPNWSAICAPPTRVVEA
jgi:hypothetical protein